MNTREDKKTADKLLRHWELNATDTARLILECAEELGERANGLRRDELIKLLRRTLREGVAALAASERTVTFAEAAHLSIEARAHRRPTTRRDLRHYVRRMLKVDRVAERPLRQMTGEECRHILRTAFGGSPSSMRKGRAILHSIFAFGIRREWVDSNPVNRVDSPNVREKTITPLTLTQAHRLLDTATHSAHRAMRLSLHLMLYCGLRPTEVQRLSPADINWKEHQIYVRPETSKTGGSRIVPLRCHNLLKKEDRRIPRNWIRRWRNLRRAAGFRQNWAPDTCRHTFASYHAAHFRNLPELQLEMGHRDTSLLRSRYISAVSFGTAKRFWTFSGKTTDKTLRDANSGNRNEGTHSLHECPAADIGSHKCDK